MWKYLLLGDASSDLFIIYINCFSEIGYKSFIPFIFVDVEAPIVVSDDEPAEIIVTEVGNENDGTERTNADTLNQMPTSDIGTFIFICLFVYKYIYYIIIFILETRII